MVLVVLSLEHAHKPNRTTLIFSHLLIDYFNLILLQYYKIINVMLQSH